MPVGGLGLSADPVSWGSCVRRVQVWYPMTVCTNSYYQKQLIKVPQPHCDPHCEPHCNPNPTVTRTVTRTVTPTPL